MSAPSTTSYVPLDSEAPAVFNQIQKNNHMISTLCISHLLISTISYILPPVAFIVRALHKYKIWFLSYLIGHSLDVGVVWSHYYSRQWGMVSVLSICSWLLTFWRIRLNGSGRSYSVIWFFSLGIDLTPKASMAAAKNNFHHKSLRHHMVAFVCHVQCLASHIWEWHAWITGWKVFVSTAPRRTTTVTRAFL